MKMILMALTLFVGLNSFAELLEVEIDGRIRAIDVSKRNDWISCTPGKPVTIAQLNSQAAILCSQTSYPKLYKVGAYDGECARGGFGMSKIQVHYYCIR